MHTVFNKSTVSRFMTEKQIWIVEEEVQRERKRWLIFIMLESLMFFLTMWQGEKGIPGIDGIFGESGQPGEIGESIYILYI